MKQPLKWSQRVAGSLSQCSIESASYGACILKNIDDVNKNACATEFQLFKQCIQKNIGKTKL
eukprot:gene2119-2609_t